MKIQQSQIFVLYRNNLEEQCKLIEFLAKENIQFNIGMSEDEAKQVYDDAVEKRQQDEWESSNDWNTSSC